MSRLALPSQFVAVVPIVAGVGNGLMALPLVRQLKTRAGAGRVIVVARLDAMGEPYRRLGEIDSVLVAGTPLSMLRALRAQRASVIVVPFPSNRWQYSALAAASGARHVLMHDCGRSGVGTTPLLATRLVPAERGIHDVIQNLELLRAIGVEPDLTEAPRFVVRDAEQQRAAERLRGVGDGFVAIHAGSARTGLAQAKRWSAAHYADLIAQIDAQTRLPCVLLEGPDDVGVAGEIVRRSDVRPTVVQLRGSLGDAAAILQRATVYAGADSGLAHLAAAVGTRAVTVFAPADPDRVSPYGNRELVVQPAKPCAPCSQYPWNATRPQVLCREPMCVNEVTADMVMRALRRALTSSGTTDGPPCPAA
jgi:ADP-heptose:LPS heptosyltransferase